MVLEQIFSFLNKIRSSRITETSLLPLSKLGSNPDQPPTLNTDASEFFAVWEKKGSFPLGFFINSLTDEQKENFRRKYVNSIDSDNPEEFFIGLGLVRGSGKRLGSAILLPTSFDLQTNTLYPDGLPIENPALSEIKGFPDIESAIINGKFSISEYFKNLKLFISAQDGWKFTEKGVCLQLFPTKTLFAAARIGRIFRNIESSETAALANELLGNSYLDADESSFDASKFRKVFNPADYVFPYPLDSEDTDAIIEALDENQKYFVLQPLPGTDSGKAVANLVAQGIHQKQKTAIIASRSASLQAVREALIQPSFSEEIPDYESLEADLRKKRKPFEDYYALIDSENNDSALSEILRELSKNKKKGGYRLGGKIAEVFENISLAQCKNIVESLDKIFEFKASENAKEKESCFSVLNERAFDNANFEKKLNTITELCSSKHESLQKLIEIELVTELFTIEKARENITKFKEVIEKETVDFPNWNINLQDWDTFKETILAFPNSARIWTEYREQGSNDFTPNAIDTNIWHAREIFAELRKTKMRNLSENYLSAKKLLKSTLKDPKSASNDEVLLKLADKLIEIQESRNTYKNNAALAQKLFGLDWNYEKTDWNSLERKIRTFYNYRNSSATRAKLIFLKHGHAFKNNKTELDDFIETLGTYEQLLKDFSFFLKADVFPKNLPAQVRTLLAIREHFASIQDYACVSKAISTLKEFELESLLHDKGILQDRTTPEKLLQAWLSGFLQKTVKTVPDFFSKTAKARIIESKEYRKSYDLWLQANATRIRQSLKNEPDYLQFHLEKKLVVAPKCDLLVILDAETISVTDFLNYAILAKKIILVGDEHLPTGSLDSGSILLHLLRLGVAQRRISFAYGCRHPQILQFASDTFYDGAIRTFPLPDISRENPYRRHVSDSPRKKILQAIIRHAQYHPARTLGVIAFSKDDVRNLQHALQTELKKRPDLSDYFKERGFRNTFYISTPENAVGKKRDTIFLLAENIVQGTGSEGIAKVNVCTTIAEREMHFFLADEAHFSEGEIGRLFLNFLEYSPKDNYSQDVVAIEHSPILKELALFAKEKGLSIQEDIGFGSVSIGLTVVDENNDKRYLLAAEDDSLNGSLQHSLEDREYIRPKSAEMLGWKIVRIWTPSWYIFNEDEKNHFLTTARIEQSIAPPKAESSDSEQKEPVEEQTSLVVPYRVTHPKIAGTPHDMPISELAPNALLHQLRFYVESESPIHEKQLLVRMLTLHKVSKPDPETLQVLQEGIRSALQQKIFIKTGPFFYSRNQKEIKPRYRGELPESERLLQFVSPEERALLPSEEALLKETLGLL